jgi:hypothetical protein
MVLELSEGFLAQIKAAMDYKLMPRAFSGETYRLEQLDWVFPLNNDEKALLLVEKVFTRMQMVDVAYDHLSRGPFERIGRFFSKLMHVKRGAK